MEACTPKGYISHTRMIPVHDITGHDRRRSMRLPCIVRTTSSRIPGTILSAPLSDQSTGIPCSAEPPGELRVHTHVEGCPAPVNHVGFLSNPAFSPAAHTRAQSKL